MTRATFEIARIIAHRYATAAKPCIIVHDGLRFAVRPDGSAAVTVSA